GKAEKFFGIELGELLGLPPVDQETNRRGGDGRSVVPAGHGQNHDGFTENWLFDPIHVADHSSLSSVYPCIISLRGKSDPGFSGLSLDHREAIASKAIADRVPAYWGFGHSPALQLLAHLGEALEL